MKTLRDIFWGLSKHADKWDPYFDVYETHFGRFRGRAPRLLEIGVQHGGSSQMWLDYFGEGTRVVGVDIDPRCAQHAQPAVEIVIGDQGSDAFWRGFFEEHPEPFDIVIDDGSHYQRDMILTFLLAAPHVRDGGVFLVEDTHTSYYPHHQIPPRAPDPDTGLYGKNSFMEFAKAGADMLNLGHIHDRSKFHPMLAQSYERVTGMHVYDSVVVYDIGTRTPFSRCLNHGQRMF
jgi:SAM-dependent methyltransferase